MTSLTSIAALKSKSSVIIAVDGRMCLCDYATIVSNVFDKVITVDGKEENLDIRKVYLAFSGDISLMLTLKEQLPKAFENDPSPSPSQVAENVKLIMEQAVKKEASCYGVVAIGIGEGGELEMFFIESYYPKKVVESTEPVVESTEPVVESIEPVVESTEPDVESTEPVVESTESPQVSTEVVESPQVSTEVVESTEPVSTEVVESTEPVSTEEVKNISMVVTSKRVEEAICVAGSGGKFLERFFQEERSPGQKSPENMELEEANRHLLDAMIYASKRDAGSGGVFQFVSITKENDDFKFNISFQGQRGDGYCCEMGYSPVLKPKMDEPKPTNKRKRRR